VPWWGVLYGFGSHGCGVVVDVEVTNAVTFMRSSEKLGPLPSARRGWSLPDQPRHTSGNVTDHRNSSPRLHYRSDLVSMAFLALH
jgi:hypothetical protein